MPLNSFTHYCFCPNVAALFLKHLLHLHPRCCPFLTMPSLLYLRQDLTMQPWLAWNLPCRQGWPPTHGDPLVSAPRVPGLKAYVTIPDISSHFSFINPAGFRIASSWISCFYFKFYKYKIQVAIFLPCLYLSLVPRQCPWLSALLGLCNLGPVFGIFI